MKNLFPLLLSLLLVSCNKLEKGAIISKYYEPERTYIQLVAVPCGKTLMLTPQKRVDDEDWVVIVRGISRGDTLIERHEMNKSDYLRFKCGDSIYFD